MKKLLFLLFCTGLGLPVAGQRWQIDPDGGIVWRPGNDTPHRDHLEMTGEQISTVLRWVVDDRGAFRVERSLIFPLLRVRPNDTHASLMCRVATDIPSLLAVNTSASGFNASALQFERVEKIVIDGTVRVFSQWSFNAVGAGYEEVEHPAPVLAMERTIFPSPTQPALCERYLIRNIGSQTLEISIPEFSQIVATPSEALRAATSFGPNCSMPESAYCSPEIRPWWMPSSGLVESERHFRPQMSEPNSALVGSSCLQSRTNWSWRPRIR